MANLRIIRDAGWRDKFRNYTIFLDGAEVGKIKEGGELKLVIPPGRHRIIAKIDWCSSPEVEFEASDTETVEFSLTSALRGIRVFFAIFYIICFRSSYLRLKRVS